MKNVGNAITIIILLIGLAVGWGILQSDVKHNTDTLTAVSAVVRDNTAEIIDGRITREQILTKLSYIEALLLELREKDK